MLDRLGRCWRLCATGLCFAVFGAGGLVLGVLVFPPLLLVRDRARRVWVARAIIGQAFRGFVALMQTLGVLRYQIIGRERLERGGLLILANHPSLIDTIFLMAFVRRADCIVKSGLWNNPFTCGPVRAAGYLSNESGPQLVDACIASLRAGNNLIVFPEGTRTPACGTIRLKRGAANIAIRGNWTVTPVLIDCQPPTLGKGESWWQVPQRRVQFRIEVREDIDVGGFIAHAGSEVMAVRHLTDHLQRFFTEEKHGHA